MPKLIFTADDYGAIDEIDEGILDAIDEGLINSVAVFANGPEREKRFAKLKRRQDDPNLQFDIGCHLTISAGAPLSEVRRFNKGKYFRPWTDIKRKGTLSKSKRKAIQKDLRIELEAQVNELSAAGLEVKHLSNHHNVLDLFPEYQETVIELARDMGLALRSPIIKPWGKNKLFIIQLMLRTLTNLDFLDIKQMEMFNKRLKSWLNNYRNDPEKNANAPFPDMPDFTDGRHYGPVPPSKVRRGSYSRKVRKRSDEMLEYLESLKDDDSCVEIVFHLRRAEAGFDPSQAKGWNPQDIVKKYRRIRKKFEKDSDSVSGYYPGVNENYLDSRLLEMLSLREIHRKSPEITLSSWGNI